MSRKTACAVLIIPLQVVNGITYAMNERVSFMIGVVVAHGPKPSFTETELLDSSSLMFRVSDFTVIKGNLQRGALVHLTTRGTEAEFIQVVDEEVH